MSGPLPKWLLGLGLALGLFGLLIGLLMVGAGIDAGPREEAPRLGLGLLITAGSGWLTARSWRSLEDNYGPGAGTGRR